MNILVVGTNRFSHYELIAMGCELTMITRLPGAFATDLTKGYKALHYVEEGSTNQQIVNLGKQLNTDQHFDAVVSFHDDYQAIATELCQCFGLKSIYSNDEIEVCRDKYLMRKKLRLSNLSSIRTLLCKNVDDVPAAVNEIGFPCIIKPVCGTASKSIGLVSDNHDLQAWLLHRKGSKTHELWVVESFVEGEELSIEAFSENGCHRVIAITQKQKRSTDFIETGHLVPASTTQEQSLEIIEHVESVLNALAIQNGPTHTEVIVNSSGIETIETHTRTGGDRIPQLVNLSCGIDMNKLAALQITGESVIDAIPKEIKYSRTAAIAFKCVEYDVPKTIESIRGVQALRERNDVVDVKLYKKQGDSIAKLLNSFDRIAHVIVVGNEGGIDEYANCLLDEIVINAVP